MKRLFCALLLGCSSPSEPPSPPHWQVVSELDRVALTVHVAAPGDVWIGGGGLGTGPGALLLHGDGAHLTEVTTGRSETLWWIGGSARDDLWAVGERGLALHGDGTTWTAVDTGTTATLFGVWARSKTDAWAVGGSPNGAGPTDVLLHWDGTRWSPIAPPTKGASFFKVWGGDDVIVVGVGVALRGGGSTWTEIPVPNKTSLFTVAGGSSGIYAVGGGPATLLRLKGTSFESLPLPDTASGILSGVSVAGDGSLFIVGERAQRYRRSVDGTFHDDSQTLELAGIDLHATAATSDGALAVGGNYMALTRPGTKARGVILRYAP